MLLDYININKIKNSGEELKNSSTDDDLFLEKIDENCYKIIGTDEFILIENVNDNIINVIKNGNRIYKIENYYGIIKENVIMKFKNEVDALQESLEMI